MIKFKQGDTVKFYLYPPSDLEKNIQLEELYKIECKGFYIRKNYGPKNYGMHIVLVNKLNLKYYVSPIFYLSYENCKIARVVLTEKKINLKLD